MDRAKIPTKNVFLLHFICCKRWRDVTRKRLTLLSRKNTIRYAVLQVSEQHQDCLLMILLSDTSLLHSRHLIPLSSTHRYQTFTASPKNQTSVCSLTGTNTNHGSPLLSDLFSPPPLKLPPSYFSSISPPPGSFPALCCCLPLANGAGRILSC